MRMKSTASLFITSLLFFVQYVQAQSLSMDAFSPYATICVNILGTNYKFPGGNCTSAYRKAICYCEDPNFVETVVTCINQYIKLDTNESMASETRNAAYQTVMDTCANLTMSDLQGYENKTHNLPTYFGKDSGERPGNWPVKSAFKLTEKELRDALTADDVYGGHMLADKRYASALLAYWAGVIVLKSIMHFFTMFFPRAALKMGNTSVGRFIRGNFQIRWYRFTDCTPSQMLIVGGFIILTAFLTFLNMHYYSPNYAFQYNDAATYGYVQGYRAAVSATYILPLFFAFAGRNNILQFITGWPQEPFLFFHRWIGRVEVLMVLVHALSFTAHRVSLRYYGEMWSLPFWRWGVVGMAFGAFIFVQSMKYIRKLHYELFLVCHIIAAVLFVVAAWRHIDLLMSFVFLNTLYATVAVWGFDRLVRICRVLYCGPKKCCITLEGNMLVMTMNKPKLWSAKISPGAYVFVHFLMPLQFWQSHPLTLTTSCTDPTKIKLYFRVYKGLSKTLANKIEKSGETSLEMPVLLDGPYGATYNFSEYDECLFIAGGSGITVPLAYIQNALARAPSRKLPKIRLCWAMSDLDALATFREDLLFLKNEAHVHVEIYASPRNSEKEVLSELGDDTDMSKGGSYEVHPLRLDASQVVEESVADISGNMSVMCCGPVGLHVATRNAICDNMTKTRYYIQYFEEAYSW